MLTGTKNVGCINEKGYLAGMTRRGFSPAKCVLELVANSLDSLDSVKSYGSMAKKFVTDVKREKISLIDNGVGMSLDDVENMFSLHRENHSTHASRGVSGIGAKPALSILSGKTEVNIFTHRQDGTYLHIKVPWGTIHSSGIYTGMVEIVPMTEEERAEFIREREENGMLNSGFAHGTSIRFLYNDSLKQVLEANALSIREECSLKNLLDRVGVVFGRDNIEIVYKHYDTPQKPSIIDKYNYFDSPESQFYTGKAVHTIEHWYSEKDNHDRFIWRRPDGNKEIVRSGLGFSKEPRPCVRNTIDYILVGEYTVLCGMRYDTSVFDPEAPVEISGKKLFGQLNTIHLGEDCTEFLAQFKLVRNNQLIGLIPIPDISVSSARANGESYIDIVLVQAEIRFNPTSSQDNNQDRVMGIQENKNQFDGANVPIELTRLVQCMKKEKALEIREYFRECLEQAAAQSQPEPESQPQPEPEPESQPEPEPESQPEPEPESQPQPEPESQPEPQQPIPAQEDSRWERVQSWIEKGLEESCILYLYKPMPADWGHDDDYDVEIRCNSAIINIKTDSEEAYNDLKNSLIDFISDKYEEDEDGCLWS